MTQNYMVIVNMKNCKYNISTQKVVLLNIIKKKFVRKPKTRFNKKTDFERFLFDTKKERFCWNI